MNLKRNIVDWIHLAQDGLVTVSCAFDNEPSCYITGGGGNFLISE